METEIENNALARAKADLADFDRKIALATAEEERLAAERQRWEAERGKVQSFVEMYQRYAGDPSAEVTGVSDVRSRIDLSKSNSLSEDTHSAISNNVRKRRPPIHRKPPNTPTTHEMILTALRDAESRGLPGLAPKDIGTFIKQKWWPHLKGSSVGPAAWRMYQDKEIRKEGGLYAPLAS